ncbi:MAG: hypothetical protein JRE62_06730 [Deltaproteobacteria bacterium]|jgi:hypothetical protein|nr:hypothetical protein [Deltaproteobacteria bacterium]
MPQYDLNEFLKLSSVLNYNLSAASLNRYNVMMYIIGGKTLDRNASKDREKKGLIMDALGYLFSAYQQKRRHLGPMAVLHPLRATALFARNQKRLDTVGLLSVLFHDIMEDINSNDFDASRWKDMEGRLYSLLERLSDENESKLLSHIIALTRTERESYYQYIGRLLESAGQSPQLVHVKLADRLDNTLDMRIELEDPLAGVDFFKNVFQLMFVNNYRGYMPSNERAPATAMNGARRLHQLFKNTVLLSLIRQHQSIGNDHALRILFEAVCDASLKEAQRTLMHLLGYHFKNLAEQRKLILEAMDYSFSGRIDLVTKPDREQLLDGLFTTYFAHNSKSDLRRQLDILYQNKPLMIQASIAFVVIFLHFLNDTKYYIHGISAEGIEPR